MSTREASLRLRWDQASFGSQVRASAAGMKREFEGAARDIGAAMKRGIGAGMGSVKGTLGELGGQLKRALGFAATLGGAVSIGQFTRQAVAAEEQAGAIAAQLRRLNEDGAKTGDVLAFATDQARKLSQTTEDVTSAYSSLLDETGDPVFSRDALASVAQFQHAFRLAGPEAAGLVGALRDGLKATSDQLRGDFGPALRDAISQGGINAQELAAMAPQIVKTMTTIGSQGGAGFVELVGLINMTEGALGGVEAALQPVGKLLLALRSQNLGKLGAQLGIRFDKASSSAENLQKIMAAKGGVEALEKAFGKSAKTAGAFRALMLGFEEEQKRATDAGKKPAEARRLAAEKFSAELGRMTRVTSTAADVEKDAADKLAEKGERFRLAVDRMAMAFTKPEILDAMDKLAGALPAVAGGFSKLVSLVAENPWEAAGGAALIRIGVPALVAAVGAAMRGGKGGAAAALGGASSVAVMNVGVLNVGPGIPGGGGPSVPGAPAAIPAMRSFRLAPAGAAGAAGTGAAVLGGAAALAAGLVVGDQIRQATIDPEQRRQVEALTSGADSALSNAESALGSGDLRRKFVALESVRRSRGEVEGTRGGVTDFLNTVGAVFGGAKEPEQLRREKLAALSEAEARLQAQIDRRVALEARLAAAGEATAKAFEGVTKTARGVRRPAAPLPGSSPAPGGG